MSQTLVTKFRMRVYQVPDLTIQLIFGNDEIPDPSWKLLSDQDIVSTKVMTPHAETLLGAYTSSSDGAVWNFGTGVAQDQALTSGLQSLSQALGHSINAYNIFPVWGDENTWDQNLGSALKSIGQIYGSDFVPVVGLKLFWPSTAPQNYVWEDPNGFTDVANGKFDAMWKSCVDQVSANGIKTVMWRIAYEYNFEFMPDSQGWSASQEAAFRAAFEHVSNIIKTESAAKGIKSFIMLNPALGNGSQPVESTLPDVNSFDILAADMYNQYYGADDINIPANRVNYWTTMYYGMNNHIALAKSLNKPIYFAECGAGPNPKGVANGIANDAAFWDFMAASIKSMRAEGVQMLGMNIWNIQAGDGSWQFTGGLQPDCQAAIAKYVADGTFIGDPI